MDDTMLDLISDICQVHLVSTASRAFHLQAVAVELMESLKRLNDKEGGSEPDGSSPIRISSKHARMRIAGPVIYAEALAIHIHRVRVVLVSSR
jgi:hypothetical protein